MASQEKAGTKVPLTIDNAKEGLRIVCSDHPEWGEFSIRSRYLDKTWEIGNDRGERVLFQDEFRFWELAPSASGNA